MAEGPLEYALELARALEEREVSYAIGGALAYGYWGIPRATIDVDINVFVDEHALQPVFETLVSLGVEVDPEKAMHEVDSRGYFAVRMGMYRLDLFTNSIPFCAEAERTRVRVSLDAQQAWILSAESIAVFKMMFKRPKDIADLEGLLAMRGADFDVAYVREQLVDMMGSHDERVVRWDQLVAERRSSIDEYEVQASMRVRGSTVFVVLKRGDGTTFEREADANTLGKIRDGDTVRVGENGSLEVVRERDRDRSRGR